MKTCMAVLLMLFVPFSFAETTIYAIEIPGLHQKDGNGSYDEIIDAGLVRKGLAKLKLLPPARAESNFESCTDCCLSPANNNPEFYDYGSDIQVSEPMGIAKIIIFSQPGASAVSGLSSLEGKTVGLRLGMPYGKSFDQVNLDTQTTTSIINNIRKLMNGRIDYMVAYTPDAYDAFQSLGQEPLPHDPTSPLAVHNDSMICRGVSESTLKVFNDYVLGLPK